MCGKADLKGILNIHPTETFSDLLNFFEQLKPTELINFFYRGLSLLVVRCFQGTEYMATNAGDVIFKRNQDVRVIS